MNYQGTDKEPEHFQMDEPGERTISRTWRVPFSLVDRLYARAKRERVYPSELVAWLLVQGLDRLETGAWTLPTAPAHRNVIMED